MEFRFQKNSLRLVFRERDLFFPPEVINGDRAEVLKPRAGPPVLYQDVHFDRSTAVPRAFFDQALQLHKGAQQRYAIITQSGFWARTCDWFVTSIRADGYFGVGLWDAHLIYCIMHIYRFRCRRAASGPGSRAHGRPGL